MVNTLSSMNIYRVLLLVLFLVMTSTVEPSSRWSTSSCGNIHNISYPFRLTSNSKYSSDLTCEDNHTVLYLDGGRYYVQSIDYSANLTRLVDDGLQKDSCSSLPRNSVLGNGPSSTQFNQTTLIIVNCSKPISSSLYIAAGPCTERSYSSSMSSNWNLYALVNPKASNVREFCNISRWTWIDYFGVQEQINSSSYNYEQIHDIMADGFVFPFSDAPSSPFKNTFFCYFDFYIYFHFHYNFFGKYYDSRRQICGAKYSIGGKHWLAMKLYPIVAFSVHLFNCYFLLFSSNLESERNM